MNTRESSLIALARKPDLDQETAFTICRMLNSVGPGIVQDWDWDWLEGENKDYRDLINHAWLEDAWKLLSEKDWYSEQTISDEDKKISTIAPLEDMTRLRALGLQNNLIQDLQPISGMKELRSLNFYRNRVSDIAPLKGLQKLEKVSLAKNPIESFDVLEELPNLRELDVSADQLGGFSKCKRLPRLVNLSFGFDGPIEDFRKLPEMPSLRTLMACANRLDGIERFTSLFNLTVFDGNVSSVSLLEGLKGLTHLSLSTSDPLDVSPLQNLSELRSLYVGSPRLEGVERLVALPCLHKFEVKDGSCDASELKIIREKLTPWENEFVSSTLRFAPSLEIEIVDQATFDYYDSKARYGITPDDENKEMLESEHEWLVGEMTDFLASDFDDNKDFILPHTSGTRRSERLIIYSMFAYESLPQIITGIQRILRKAQNNWIIWFQSSIGELGGTALPDNEDFIVWIYPSKIVATQKNARIVHALIDAASKKSGATKSVRNTFRKLRRLIRRK